MQPEGGPSDDTEYLQSLLDRGEKITLENSRVYTVSGRPGETAALYVGSNTDLDLAGSTLKLADNQLCALIGLKPESRVRNVRIANGRIFGNGQNQPAEYRHAFVPTMFLKGCDGLELRDLEMQQTYMYAVYVHGNDGHLENISVDDAVGGGVHLTGARWDIDNIKVRNVTSFDPVNSQGNPFIVSLKGAQIGDIYCENYGFGVKFQDGCENVTVRSIEAVGGPNNNDYLVKVQGTKDTARNRNIRIAKVLAKNGPYSGLYIIYSDDVQIGSYSGENNGQLPSLLDLKNASDILIIDSDNVHFGDLQVTGVQSVGLWLHDRTGRVSAESAEIQTQKGGSGVYVVSGVAELAGTVYSCQSAGPCP